MLGHLRWHDVDAQASEQGRNFLNAPEAVNMSVLLSHASCMKEPSLLEL